MAMMASVMAAYSEALAKCWRDRAQRVGIQHRRGGREAARVGSIGTADHDDRHARADHQPRRLGIRHEGEIL